MRWLVTLIIIVPALEIGLLLFSGRTLGVMATIFLIILTGVLGAYLAKRQGLETIRRVQEELRYGSIPGNAILDGLCILVGGVVLLTPGFITDTIGFLLLFPSTRNMLKPIIEKIIRKLIDQNRITIIRP
ncbi:FxsA family protein [Bacillus sp. FJAT-47783]|uniref:FxsA family protein n=1 Tax=Bacillus sp. FJAT-47783 TaxID=2922712 RepID=UPI001FADD264|nr:FxsA family protein [Bacillus sp. FJAT-47783]